MTWEQQFIQDNTWKNSEPPKKEYCEICDKDTEQYEVSGCDGWDRYSYTVCTDPKHDQLKKELFARLKTQGAA